MADYIKREDVVEKLVRTFLLQAPTARAIVEAIPAADVVERKKGQWFRTGDEFGETWMCSECCEEWVVEESVMDEFPQWAHYCPNCGARMVTDDV